MRQPVDLAPNSSKDLSEENLWHVFNISWKTRKIPMKYKSAIFKKGKQDDTGSTRSVRLTSVLGKIMKQLMQESTKKEIKKGKRIHVIQCI